MHSRLSLEFNRDLRSNVLEALHRGTARLLLSNLATSRNIALKRGYVGVA